MTRVKRETVHTDKAPQAIGPYSQAVKTDKLIFVSGQLGLDPSTGEMADSDIQAETRQALINLKMIIEAAGSGLDKVIKTTVFIKEMNDFPKINEIYAEFFPENPPARACVEVARLPKDGHVEIEAVAVI